MSRKMILLSSSFSSRANPAAILVMVCLAAASNAKAEDSFPQTAIRADVLRWLANNSDVNASTVIAMTDEVVVAITDRQEGRGLDGSTRLALREEVINPDAVATWGGRSIQVDLDLDCSRHRVMLGVRRIYARPNLQGSVRLTRSDTTWTDAPPDTVINDIVQGVCAPQQPAPFAVAQAASPSPPVQSPAVEPSTAANAPPADASAPSPPMPVQTAEADTAPAPALSAPDTAPVAAQPPRPVDVAAADPPTLSGTASDASRASGTAPAASADPSLMVHNPFAGKAVKTAGATAKPAARPAAPPARPTEVAVQIATVASADLAMDSWQSLKTRFPGLVGPRTFAVEPVPDKGRTLYRGLLLGFASTDEAAALCKTLRGQSVDCALRQMR